MKRFIQAFETKLFSFFAGRYEKLNSVEKLQGFVLIHTHVLGVVYTFVTSLLWMSQGKYAAGMTYLLGSIIWVASFSLYRVMHHKYLTVVVIAIGFLVSFRADVENFYPTRLLVPGLYIMGTFIIGGLVGGTAGFLAAVGLYLNGVKILGETPKNSVNGVLILLIIYGMVTFFYRNLYKAYKVVDLERKVAKGLLDEISNILNHIKQGIFVFDQKLNTIRKSRFLDSIVKTSKSTQVQSLLDNSSLSADQVAQAYTVLGSVFNEESISFEANNHLLPRSIIYLNEFSLEIDWEPLTNDEHLITHILVVVRDMTELNKIREEEKEKDRELKAFSLFLGKKKEGLRRFIADAQETYKIALGEIKQENYSKKELAHHLHTIKGNARTLGLLEIANAVHHNETLLQGGAEPVDLVSSLEQTYDGILYYRNVEKKIFVNLGRDSLPEKITSELFRCNEQKVEPDKTVALLNQLIRFDTLESILVDQVESLPQLAEDLGKPAPEVEIHAQSIVINREISSKLQAIFVHIFNNSLDHGIETLEERKQANKNPTPRIQISATLDNYLSITVRDDGKGLDLERLRKKSNRDAKTNDDEIANSIFDEGMSTKSNVTLVSGRGIGMSAVKEVVEEIQGRIFIDLDSKSAGKKMSPFALRMQFPKELAELKTSA